MHRRFRYALLTGLLLPIVHGPARVEAQGREQGRAISDPTIAYMRQLAGRGPHVLVVEYFDPKLNAAVDRFGLTSKAPFAAAGPTTIKGSASVALRLSGIVPCATTDPITYEEFSGPCPDLTRYGLAQVTRNARVLLCRAYLDQKGKPEQEVACFAYTQFPGALESVDMIEDTLVGQGMAFVARDTVGTPLRPDLVGAERLAQGQGLALWSMNPVPKPGATP